MAMSYHMEARIRQDRLNRWFDQKRRAEQQLQTQGIESGAENVALRQPADRVLVTDPGQFYQIRSFPTGRNQEVPYETGVIFNKVVHDPNFNYRLAKALRGNLLHVNPIYSHMYPGSFYYQLRV